MKSTHLIYLQKFSDPVNEAVNSISRKKETEKYSNVLSGLICRNMPKQQVKCFGTVEKQSNIHCAPPPASV